MTRIEESIIIKCPADKAFTYTTEAKSWPKWHAGIPEAEQTSQGPVGVGTTFKWKYHAMGMTQDWTGKLTEYTPYKKWAKAMTTKSMAIDDQLIFDPVEVGTKFTIVYDMNMSGFLKLLSPMVVSSTRKQLKADLISIKNILEAQP